MSYDFQDKKYDIKTEKGFRLLFDEFYPSMYHYAKRIVENKQAADDISQEVFMHLWDRRAELKITSYAGFLYTSIRHKCMNYLRAEKIRALKRTEFEENISIQVDDRLLLIEEEMIREIRRLINQLPEQQQKVFELHLDGLGQQEIADELGISINTVKTHKLKARQFLKSQLKHTLYMLLLLRF